MVGGSHGYAREGKHSTGFDMASKSHTIFECTKSALEDGKKERVLVLVLVLGIRIFSVQTNLKNRVGTRKARY